MSGVEQLTIRDSFIDLAETVCRAEVRTLEHHGRDMLSWRPLDDSLFKEPIELYQVILGLGRPADSFFVTQATFKIRGENEADITISRSSPDTLENDSFAQFMLEKFSDSYGSHSHSSCFQILRIARQQEVRKRGLLRAQNPSHFTLQDNRTTRLEDVSDSLKQ